MVSCEIDSGSKTWYWNWCCFGIPDTILIFLAARNPREAKFYMYYYLKVDTVPKDDKNEKLENMQYDAFFVTGKSVH